MTFLRHTTDSFLHLLYPEVCLVCEHRSVKKSEAICVQCRYDLPQTGFHQVRDNLLEERLRGRIPFEAATALYYFKKGGKVQQLLHLLKYAKKPHIGIKIGELYGNVLMQSSLFQQIDTIVPVPLVEHRQRWRGYNQSERFAYGLSFSMQKPLIEPIVREKFQSSQTKKNAIERVENVFDSFRVHQPSALLNKHVLLVDDVVTTGATLEACANEICKYAAQVSIAAIAIAQ